MTTKEQVTSNDQSTPSVEHTQSAAQQAQEYLHRMVLAAQSATAHIDHILVQTEPKQSSPQEQHPGQSEK